MVTHSIIHVQLDDGTRLDCYRDPVFSTAWQAALPSLVAWFGCDEYELDTAEVDGVDFIGLNGQIVGRFDGFTMGVENRCKV